MSMFLVPCLQWGSSARTKRAARTPLSTVCKIPPLLEWYFTSQLSATDASARTTMKGAAKCDKHCKLQNSANQQDFERILRFRDMPESMPGSEPPTPYALGHFVSEGRLCTPARFDCCWRIGCIRAGASSVSTLSALSALLCLLICGTALGL